MPYVSERYSQGISCYCERCAKIHNKRGHATTTRMFIVRASTDGGYQVYMCLSCIQEVMYLMTVGVTTPGTTFTYDRDTMIRHMNGSGSKSSVNADNLREKMSRFEEDFRSKIKKIRNYDGKYTDRNVACKEIMNMFKNVFAEVETYLQNT
jgi:hypothetical protein